MPAFAGWYDLTEGLRYLASLLMVKTKILDISQYLSCSTAGLRRVNVIFHSLLGPLLFSLQRQKLGSRQRYGEANAKRVQMRMAHNSLNIGLFPPLFFFSALYYTDIMSTVAVLLQLWLRQYFPASTTSSLRSPLLFLTGFVSLMFRQTNIFWTAVFPAILDAIDVVAIPAPFNHLYSAEQNFMESSHLTRALPSGRDTSWTDAIRKSWSGELLIDLPMTDAVLDGKLPSTSMSRSPR